MLPQRPPLDWRREYLPIRQRYSVRPNIPGAFDVSTGSAGYFSVTGSGPFFAYPNGAQPIVINSSAITYQGVGNNKITFSPDLVNNVFGASTTVQTASMRILCLMRAY